MKTTTKIGLTKTESPLRQPRHQRTLGQDTGAVTGSTEVECPHCGRLSSVPVEEPSDTLDLPDDVELMTAEHAQRIWEFVDRWAGEVGAIVCHCEQGMSRSPAVAIGVCVGLGEDPSELIAEFSPNAFVQQLVVGVR